MGKAILLKGGGKNMSAPRWVLQTVLGRYKTEREMGSPGLNEYKISSVIIK